MALVATTLSAAITATDHTFNLTSGTSVAVGRFLRVDDEFMVVQAFDGSTQVTVQRGRWGTNAMAHGILASAVHGAAADFSVRPKWHIYTYGAAAPAITPAKGLHRFSYAGAIAATLAAPTADMEGEELLFVSTVAQAHVITLDSGYFNNTTNNKATWGGAIGDCLKVVVVLAGTTPTYAVTVNKNITLGT